MKTTKITLTGEQIKKRFAARVAAGRCGDCGVQIEDATTCKACFHRHYCAGRPCVCS